MNVLPVRDFVAVTKDDEERDRKTASGLYMPTLSEEKVITGTVVAVGSGRVTMSGAVVPLDVKVGDKVAFNKNMVTEVKVGNESSFLLREDQILCVIK